MNNLLKILLAILLPPVCNASQLSLTGIVFIDFFSNSTSVALA